MLDLKGHGPKGVLGDGWTANVDDYAIACCWTLGGKLLVVADAVGGVYAYDDKSGTRVWMQHKTHDGGILAMSVHPNGTTFATAGQDGRVLVWGIAEGHINRHIDVDTDWVENVAWSLDGKWLAASCSRKVHIYNSSGEEVWRSDDGDVVACGSQDNSVHFWRRSTEQDSMMSGYPAKPAALTFDDTGTLLATGGGAAITVWSFQGNGPEGTRPGILDFHVQPVTRLSFARRGMLLASTARDGVVAVWSLQEDGNGDPIGAAVLADLGTDLCWRADATKLAAIDAQGGVTVWKVG